MFSMKIEGWTVKYKSGLLRVYIKGKEKKVITLDNLLANGMILFPKQLHKLIGCDITHANKYDKFTDKLFTLED